MSAPDNVPDQGLGKVNISGIQGKDDGGSDSSSDQDSSLSEQQKNNLNEPREIDIKDRIRQKKTESFTLEKPQKGKPLEKSEDIAFQQPGSITDNTTGEKYKYGIHLPEKVEGEALTAKEQSGSNDIRVKDYQYLLHPEVAIAQENREPPEDTINDAVEADGRAMTRVGQIGQAGAVSTFDSDIPNAGDKSLEAQITNSVLTDFNRELMEKTSEKPAYLKYQDSKMSFLNMLATPFKAPADSLWYAGEASKEDAKAIVNVGARIINLLGAGIVDGEKKQADKTNYTRKPSDQEPADNITPEGERHGPMGAKTTQDNKVVPIPFNLEETVEVETEKLGKKEQQEFDSLQERIDKLRENQDEIDGMTKQELKKINDKLGRELKDLWRNRDKANAMALGDWGWTMGREMASYAGGYGVLTKSVQGLSKAFKYSGRAFGVSKKLNKLRKGAKISPVKLDDAGWARTALHNMANAPNAIAKRGKSFMKFAGMGYGTEATASFARNASEFNNEPMILLRKAHRDGKTGMFFDYAFAGAGATIALGLNLGKLKNRMSKFMGRHDGQASRDIKKLFREIETIKKGKRTNKELLEEKRGELIDYINQFDFDKQVLKKETRSMFEDVFTTGEKQLQEGKLKSVINDFLQTSDVTKGAATIDELSKSQLLEVSTRLNYIRRAKSLGKEQISKFMKRADYGSEQAYESAKNILLSTDDLKDKITSVYKRGIADKQAIRGVTKQKSESFDWIGKQTAYTQEQMSKLRPEKIMDSDGAVSQLGEETMEQSINDYASRMIGVTRSVASKDSMRFGLPIAPTYHNLAEAAKDYRKKFQAGVGEGKVIAPGVKGLQSKFDELNLSTHNVGGKVLDERMDKWKDLSIALFKIEREANKIGRTFTEDELAKLLKRQHGITDDNMIEAAQFIKRTNMKWDDIFREDSANSIRNYMTRRVKQESSADMATHRAKEKMDRGLDVGSNINKRREATLDQLLNDDSIEMNFNMPQVMQQYYGSALKERVMDSPLREMDEMIRKMTAMGGEKAAEYWKSVAKDAANLFRAGSGPLDDTMSNMAKKMDKFSPGDSGKVRQWLRTNDGASGLVDLAYLNFLGYKSDFALKNLSQNLNTVGRMGFSNTMRGFKTATKPKSIQATNELLKKANLRQFRELYFESASMSGKKDMGSEKAVDNMWEGLKRKAKQAKDKVTDPFLNISASDNINVKTAWLGEAKAFENHVDSYKNGDMSWSLFTEKTGIDTFRNEQIERLKVKVDNNDLHMFTNSKTGKGLTVDEAIELQKKDKDAVSVDLKSAQGEAARAMMQETQWEYGSFAMGTLFHKAENDIMKMTQAALSVFSTWNINMLHSTKQLFEKPIKNSDRISALLASERLFESMAMETIGDDAEGWRPTHALGLPMFNSPGFQAIVSTTAFVSGLSSGLKNDVVVKDDGSFKMNLDNIKRKVGADPSFGPNTFKIPYWLTTNMNEDGLQSFMDIMIGDGTLAGRGMDVTENVVKMTNQDSPDQLRDTIERSLGIEIDGFGPKKKERFRKTFIKELKRYSKWVVAQRSKRTPSTMQEESMGEAYDRLKKEQNK